MLHRRILPIQLRATAMWEHKPEEARIVLNFRSTLAGMWTWLLVPAKDKIPKERKDLSFEYG